MGTASKWESPTCAAGQRNHDHQAVAGSHPLHQDARSRSPVELTAGIALGSTNFITPVLGRAALPWRDLKVLTPRQGDPIFAVFHVSRLLPLSYVDVDECRQAMRWSIGSTSYAALGASQRKDKAN